MKNYNNYIDLYGADMAPTMIEFENVTDELLDLLDLHLRRGTLSQETKTVASKKNENSNKTLIQDRREFKT